ncbi:MAG: helix-hairpin-helix domain-containing protein [Anaerovoracaceae bacterium]
MKGNNQKKEKSNFSIKEFIGENKAIVTKVIVITIIAAFALGVFFYEGQKEQKLKVSKAAAVESVEKEKEIESVIVDISGAVNMPAVIELPVGSRVEDAIVAAGGLKKSADISNINRAATVEDGEKILIPKKAENNENASETSNDSSGIVGGKVNINLASESELQTLTGVGPVTAAKIIDYRNTVSRFKKIDDLKQVSGIGDKTFENLKPYISI